MYNFICFSVFFVNICFCDLQSSTSSVTPDYAWQDRKTYAHAAADYLGKLSSVCRYRNTDTESKTLPPEFVVTEQRVGPRTLRDIVHFAQDAPVAQALDTILIPPTNDKWVIDCMIATALAQLQGLRTMFNNDDDMFNSFCAENLQTDSLGSLKCITFPNIYIRSSAQTNAEFKISGIYLPGSLNYFSQLQLSEPIPEPIVEPEAVIALQDKNKLAPAILVHSMRVAKLLTPFLKRQITVQEAMRDQLHQLMIMHASTFNGVPLPYCIKYPRGVMGGMHTLCLGDDRFMYFETGGAKCCNAYAMAYMLVDAMNADNISESYTHMNLLGYPDRNNAAREILREMVIKDVHFEKLRVAINSFVLRIFCEKIAQDASFREVLREAMMQNFSNSLQ